MLLQEGFVTTTRVRLPGKTSLSILYILIETSHVSTALFGEQRAQRAAFIQKDAF
jgi:hypothetical protein